MDLLLNPNIAYLLLVLGFSFSILAIMAPGTGLLEITALFALLMAGYSVYNLPINWWALLVLILGVFPFVLALRKSRQIIFLVLSILALVVGSIFLFRGESWQPAVNPFLALLVSVLVGVFFWFAARKVLEAELTRPSHDLGALIGEMGEAKTEIGPEGEQEGTVQVGGELWSARSRSPIPAGSSVRVIARDGLVLEVEPKNSHT